MVILAPFSYLLYTSIPEDATSYDTWFGTITVNEYWETVQQYVYTILQKLYVLFLTVLLFFTAKGLWKFSVLVPITIVLYQLDQIFDANVRSVDDYEWYYSLPLTVPFVTTLIVLGIISYRKNINKKITLNINDKINAEYESFINENE